MALVRTPTTLIALWGSIGLFAVAAGCGDDSSPPSGSGGAKGGAAGTAGTAARAGHSGSAMTGGSGDEAGAGAETARGGTSGKGGTSGQGGTSSQGGTSPGGGTGNGGGSAGTEDGGEANGAQGGTSAQGGTTSLGGEAGTGQSGPCPAGQVAPGTTETFAHAVKVSYAADAQGCLPVSVSTAAVTLPDYFEQVDGSPSVTLGAAGAPLGGRALVEIGELTEATGFTKVIRVTSSGYVSVSETLSGETLSFATRRGGRYAAVDFVVPAPACTALTTAGGIFDGTTIATLAGTTHVTGNLTIQGNITSLSALSCLTQIDGNLTIQQTTGLQTLQGLESLVAIEHSLLVANNAGLKTLAGLGGLVRIGADLGVLENPLLETGSLPLLGTVDEIEVDDNPKLASFSVPAVAELTLVDYSGNATTIAEPSSLDLGAAQRVTGDVRFLDNGTWRLGSGLPSLELVMGSVAFHTNAELSEIAGLDALSEVRGDIEVGENPVLTTATFSVLRTLGGAIRVTANPVLELVAAPQVLESGPLDYHGNSASIASPSSFDFGKLKSISGPLIVRDNKTWRLGSGLKSLERIEGPTGDFSVFRNAELDELDELEALEAIGGVLYLSENAKLATVDGFSALASLGGTFEVRQNPVLTSFKAPKLTSLATLSYYDNGETAPAAASLDLGGVTQILGAVLLKGNTTWRLGSGLAKLETVGGDFDVFSNPHLDDLDELGALESVGGRLYVVNNAGLVSADGFTALVTLGGLLQVSTNDRLTSFKAPKVTSVASLEFRDNGSAASGPTTLDLRKLVTVNGALTLRNNTHFHLDAGLETLATVTGDFDVYDNPELPALDHLTALTSIGGRAYVFHNEGLANLELPALATLGSTLTIQTNAVLPTCDATALRDALVGHGWLGTATISGNLADACTP
jgi:hypothetical protein